jgi:hypothetical protein
LTGEMSSKTAAWIFAGGIANSLALPGDLGTGYREVPAVEPIAIGQYGDEIAAIRNRLQLRHHVGVVALRIDRAVAPGAGDGSPEAAVGVAGVLRAAARAGIRRALQGGARVVHIHQEPEARDRRSGLGINDLQVDGRVCQRHVRAEERQERHDCAAAEKLCADHRASVLILVPENRRGSCLAKSSEQATHGFPDRNGECFRSRQRAVGSNPLQ